MTKKEEFFKKAEDFENRHGPVNMLSVHNLAVLKLLIEKGLLKETEYFDSVTKEMSEYEQTYSDRGK